MRKSMLLGCLALAALASCAVMVPAGTRVPKEKQIDVNVGPKWDWFGGQAEIKVDQEKAVVRDGTVAVVWSLGARAADEGYRFESDGITFEYPAPRPPSSTCSTPDPAEAFELKKCRVEAEGRLFVCDRKGKHVKGACFKYKVRLKAEEGAEKVVDKDPWIANE